MPATCWEFPDLCNGSFSSKQFSNVGRILYDSFTHHPKIPKFYGKYKYIFYGVILVEYMIYLIHVLTGWWWLVDESQRISRWLQAFPQNCQVEHWKVAKHSTATSSLRSREQRPRVTFLIVHCCTLCLGYLGSQKSKYIEIIY